MTLAPGVTPDEAAREFIEFGPVGQVMGRRTAVWYAVSVVLLAGSFGFILNRMW